MYGKKFRFSLSSVLRVRSHETDQAQKALAAALKKRMAQEKKVAEAASDIDRLQQGSVSLQTAVTAAWLRQADGLRLDAQRRLGLEEKRLKHCLREEQQARRDLVTRRSAEQALETLRDIEKQRFQQAEQYADNKRLEEQALDVFRRKNVADKS
ncbi:MAG: hypothetical protein SH809_12990 [Rhodothermales bacterium]|nr:hypothetical protein [Rhodothermales bacterium]